MNNQELQEILELHKKWLNNEGGKRANLFGADLRGADLREDVLIGADLRGADLRGVNLEGADLRGADLRRADLRRADLEKAYLRGANLSFTKGILSFTGGQHFAFSYVYKDVKRIKIGCKDLSVQEWLENYEVIGEKERYTEEDIHNYRVFIISVNQFFRI